MLNVSDELETDDTPQVSRKLSFSAAASPVSRGVSVMPIPDLVNSLSKSAIKKRVERLMTPKQDGSHKVPAELIAEWRSGDQKPVDRWIPKSWLRQGPDLDFSKCSFQPEFQVYPELWSYGELPLYPQNSFTLYKTLGIWNMFFSKSHLTI